MTVSVDLPTIAKVLVGWCAASVVVAYGLSRWLRYVRGDFDRPPH